MIELDCIQGSAEWHAARAGIPTASEFYRIFTPSRKPSSQRVGYLHELLAEWVLGGPATEFAGNEWTERGHDLEGDARALYEFDRELTPRAVGFCYRDESRLVGCSPDWLVDPDGGAEVKAPKISTHVGFLLASGDDGEAAVPAKYVPQIQGCLWVTGRSWWDFVSYAPGFPPLIVRVEPDPAWQEAFDLRMPEFFDELLAGRERLRELGVVPSSEVEK